jgi:hypothetical protein
MTATTSVEHTRNATSDDSPDLGVPMEAVIRTLEQQASDLEEAHYEALREARDAWRRAAELRLQVLEARMQLCALVECEPLTAREPTETTVRRAVLQLMQVYFDEPGKYRLVIRLPETEGYQVSDGADVPVWCSRVVYDAARPEGKCPVAISDAVHAAYRAAEQQGFILTCPERTTP